MTFGLSLVAFAIAAATATSVLIIHEIHIRALNTRVSNAVMGIPGQSAPLPGHDRLVFIVRHAVSALLRCGNLDQLRTILQSSGFNHHRTLPIWIGVKTVSTFLFPVIALLVAQLLGRHRPMC